MTSWISSVRRAAWRLKAINVKLDNEVALPWVSDEEDIEDLEKSRVWSSLVDTALDIHVKFQLCRRGC